MIAIVDYNMGNLGSIRNMLKKLGFESHITADPQDIAAAERIILPGVGAFDAGMTALETSGLIPVLNDRVHGARVPTLGICLGMQLMTRRSEEGTHAGLGWIDADVIRFPSDENLKVPHMGWNLVEPAREAPLIADLPPEPRFYFVHSYYARCQRDEDVLLTAQYGLQFHAGFQSGNVMGVQFHPEKSHKYGMRLLQNFAGRC